MATAHIVAKRRPAPRSPLANTYSGAVVFIIYVPGNAQNREVLAALVRAQNSAI